MWERVSKKITRLGGIIHLSAKAENISVKNGNIIKSVSYRDIKTGNIFTLNADYFFSSIPIKELITNMRGKDIDQNILALANGLEYRDFLIVGLLLKKGPEGKEKNNFESLTDNWIYLQDKGIKAGRVQIFNNWSPFMVEDRDTISIGVEYFCNETDDFWNASDENISQQAIREMENVGLIKAADVKDTTVIKVRKAYPSYTGSYNHFAVLQNFLNSFENLFPIGRNGMHRYNNSDHSMMTAMISVENIIEQRKDKTNIWEVNLDEDYH